MSDLQQIVDVLEKNRNVENLAGMQRFGIRFEDAYGCSIPFLRNLSKSYKNNHKLALELWNTGNHECRILAFLIDEPGEVSVIQMEHWLRDVNSWDICDGLCNNLFRKTPYAIDKAFEWAKRNPEFEKRAGFVLMAVLAVHYKETDNTLFLNFLDVIKKHSSDERNFVRKAINWALRQIGKRNYFLFDAASETAKEIYLKGDKSSKWIAKDALKEFASETTQKILSRRKN